MSSIFPRGMAVSRRRFWVTVLCFIIANTAVWAGYDRYFAWRWRGTLRVEAFEPGQGAIVAPRPTLRWHFNTDVIPTTAYGREPGSVTPAISGRWEWEDPRTLSFKPDADLPRATRVSFTLAEAFFRSASGAALTQPCVNSVDSTPLAVEDVFQAASRQDDRFVIELKFNDRVVPGDVLQHLRITTPDKKSLNASLYGQAAGKIVRVLTDSIPRPDNRDSSLQISISPGLLGLSGPLGLEQPYQSSINLRAGLAATGLEAESPASGHPSLYLQFNNQVDMPALKEILSIDPPLPYTLEQEGSRVKILGDFQLEKRYTVKLAIAAAGSDPVRYPLPGSLAAFVGDRAGGVWFDNDQGYLSSAGNRTLVAHAMNVQGLHLSITRVYDNNLVAWRNIGRRYWTGEIAPFGKMLVERKFPFTQQKNVQHDIRLSLDELLPPAAPRQGVYLLSIEPTKSPDDISRNNQDDDDDNDYYPSSATSSVVTLSDIALTAKQTRQGAVVWATSLRTARPLQGVRIRLFSNKNQQLGQAVTNADGLATITNVHPAKGESATVVLADIPTPTIDALLGPASPATVFDQPSSNAGQDLTWLDLRHTSWELGDSDTSGSAYLRAGNEAFVYADRGVYRPGETVHLRGIVRGPGQVAPASPFPVRWQIFRSDQRRWKSQVVMLDADGAAAWDIALPTDLPTGTWTAHLGLSDDGGPDARYFGSVTFGVEEFIPNRMKVDLHFAGAAPMPRYTVSAGPLNADVQADYLFGRPAAGLSMQLSSHLDPVPFQPQGWNLWQFGDTAAVLAALDNDGHKNRRQLAAAPQEAKLDEKGHYVWAMDLADVVDAAQQTGDAQNSYTGPWRLTASADVREDGGRIVAATRLIDVDMLPYYIGVRGGDAPARPGQAHEFHLRLVRPDNSSSDDATLQATLLHESWNTTFVFQDGHYQYDSTRTLEEVQKGEVKITAGQGTWSATPPSSGSYVACFRDKKTGAYTTSDLYATDGSPWDDNVSRTNPERLDIRLLAAGESDTAASSLPANASRHFHVGDTANVLISSPFKGRMLLTVETDEVVQSSVIEMTGSHLVIPIKVTDACRPNAFVTATVIRPVDPDAKWGSHRAFGVARLNVDTDDHRLKITLNAPAIVQPLQSLDVSLLVQDSAGNPASHAAITLAAVDEGICQSTNFPTPDPLQFFASPKALSVNSSDLYEMLMPETPRPDKMSSVGGDSPGISKGTADRHITPIVAQRFKPVSLAWISVHTDSRGMATASFHLPQFQGRLRVMAVAYSGEAFGSHDQDVIVRSPILAQTTWPRFAAPTDRFDVPITLFNNTAVAGSAKVSVELLDDPATPAQLLSFSSKHQKSIDLSPVSLAAGGQGQISLPVTIGQAVGVAKIHLLAEMNGQTFDENLELPIRPAAPMLQYGSYASASTTQPATITPSVAMLAGTDSLKINVTPWPSLQLTQGLDYLDHYPYGCVEQTTSTCFPLIALGDIGRKIDPVAFDPDRIKRTIDAGVTQLIGMQTADGGLAMWSGGTYDWPWASVYAANFLVEARLGGYDVPEDFNQHLIIYVRKLLDESTDDAERLETQAYAAYVLALAGKSDRAILNRLTELSKMTASFDDNGNTLAMRSDARLFLSCAWLISGRRDLAEGLIPQVLPLPRTHRQNAGNIGSPIRDRAVLINTLIQVEPANPALPALVQQLADAGVDQKWAGTQDTAFALMALGRYLRQEATRTPYESAQLVQDTKVLAETKAGGLLAWSAPTTRPTSNAPYTVRITGPGNAIANVSWLQTGIPLTPPVNAEHGMKISRRYLSLDGKLLPGAVRTGDLVRVEITIEAPPNQSNLVIEDMLPAGLEVQNQRLLTTHQTDSDAESNDPSAVSNFQIGNCDIRDDRVVVMGAMPNSGKARFEYLTAAVTPGNFVVPPLRAEAMYDIESNAIWGAGGRFVVMPIHTNLASAGE